MANLQARIGPEVTKLYPNLSWKRPGLPSPSKNTEKSSQTRKSDEKDDDNDASSHEHASSIFSSSNKSRGSLPRPRKSSGQLSLLSRMDLSSDASQDGHCASEGKEAAGIQPSLLSRVGITEDKTPQPSLPSSSNGQRNVEKQTPDDRHNRSSQNDSHTSEPKYDGLVLKTSATEPSSILQDSSKSNYSSSNIRETSQVRLEDNLAHRKNTTVPKLRPSQEQDFEDGELSRLPPTQEQGFEDGELVDSEPLPPQQVRDFLLPLVLNNAAHRAKDGDGDLTRLTAHSVLSDEVCSSFMDQMKEVRTEMHAHQNRSSNQMQLMGETINLGPAHVILPSSKIGQTPPRGPRAMINPTITDKSMPRNGKIATTSSLSKDQPISALSNHSHDPVSSSIFEKRGPEFRHSISPERKGFHDHDRGRRYSQHRENFDDRRSRSHSHSPSRYFRGQPYRRPSDSSRHMARSRPPLVTSPGRRRSPPGPSQSTYFRDRALHESPEAISGPQSASPSGTSNHNRRPEHRPSLSRDFKRIERPGNISPNLDSPRSPVSRRRFDRPRADKVVSPHQPSFTHDRGLESPRRRRDSYVGITHSGSEFARRSMSPRRKQYRRLSAERPLPRTPPPYLPRSATPNPYCELERRRDLGADHTESVSPGTGSMSTHRTSRATGSHHPTPKPMVMENKNMHEPVNDEVRTPKTSDDIQKSRPGVLPCHNVPGIWFVKVALGDIGTLECSFEVDDVTALNWNLRRPNVNLPSDSILRKERLQLHLCCLSQKDVQSVVGSLKPDATANDVATAMLAIENNWPTPGHLIIMVNPQDKNSKRVWLPHKLESPSCLPVCIEGCVVEGQNIVQFIQLSGMSERMFVLFATTKSLSDELQHEEVILAPGYL